MKNQNKQSLYQPLKMQQVVMNTICIKFVIVNSFNCERAVSVVWLLLGIS